MKVIRYLYPSTWSYQVEIYSGDPPARIEPAAALLIHAPESPQNREAYLLELLDSSGALLESLQFDTLEIALDQARDVARIPRSAWTSADYVLPLEYDRVDLTRLHPVDYSTDHFELMIALVERLRDLPAELLDHHYSAHAFGSWCSILRFRGIVLRLVFDGRDRELVVECSSSKKQPYQWEKPFWRRPNVTKADILGSDLVSAIQHASSPS
jgi:hypothetical protein